MVLKKCLLLYIFFLGGESAKKKGVKQEWTDFYEVINRSEAKMSIRHQNKNIKMASGCVNPESRIWDGDREWGGEGGTI